MYQSDKTLSQFGEILNEAAKHLNITQRAICAEVGSVAPPIPTSDSVVQSPSPTTSASSATCMKSQASDNADS